MHLMVEDCSSDTKSRGYASAKSATMRRFGVISLATGLADPPTFLLCYFSLQHHSRLRSLSLFYSYHPTNQLIYSFD